MDQINNLISPHRPFFPKFTVFTIIVVLNFKDPKIELKPATCKEKIAKSILKPS